eukprot:TRINITY_DN38_c0_g1_i1.p1 TRINITY_DN38_c0_g1~~TRINITY_DN38_c0_g1_i1.p1  ORF type:complete len:168 (-),score=38.53 TRINITY_DN38_c0_g1_i1:198-701(-)
MNPMQRRALCLAVVLFAAAAVCVPAAFVPQTEPETKAPKGKTFEEMLFDWKELVKMIPTEQELEAMSEQIAQSILRKHNGRIDENNLNPVFLMPGFFASALMSEYKKLTVPSWRCDKEKDLHQIWINYFDINPVFRPLDCIFDTLSTSYNANTNTYSNKPGKYILSI